jgi:hypothetical protein
MDKHMCLLNNTICSKCRCVSHIVSLGELSFLLKGILPPSGSLNVSDARQTCTGISGAEGSEPALKKKTETFSNRRCHKDVIC